MCGIIGYNGKRDAIPILLKGLKNLEYRGYDSAGISVFSNGRLFIEKCEGKLSELDHLIKESKMQERSTIGIGHVRWATHGIPSKENAHPFKCGEISIVHNGIIENYRELKEELLAKGYRFFSKTDTEVGGILIMDYIKSGMDTLRAIREACKRMNGSFAFAILSERDGDTLFGVRNGSPLIIGAGEDEYFLSSDIPAISEWTSRFIPVEDGEVVQIERTGARIFDFDGLPIHRETFVFKADHIATEKGGYKHFMLKEIFEQGKAILNTIAGRLDADSYEVLFPELDDTSREVFETIHRVVIVACGTSFHAGLVGRYYLEHFSRIPVSVELASEFRYSDPIIDEKTLTIFITQSGETKDTLEGLYEAKRRKAKTLSICNVHGSTITRVSDYVLLTHAGVERAVASTKSFTTQIAVLYLFSLHFARIRGMMGQKEIEESLSLILSIPRLVDTVLKNDREFERIAKKYQYYNHFLYLGRGISYPLVMEGALKLKEISYIHAEAYAGGEMKHGPIALISPDMPSMVLAPKDQHYEKMISNIEEISARGGRLIAVGFAQDEHLKGLVDDFIEIPETSPLLLPFTASIPLQLFAYHIANLRGTDVDQPRNLAKSVTVE